MGQALKMRSRKKSNIRTVWVEKLGCPDIINLFFRSLFYDTIVRYDENRVSLKTGRVLYFLQYCGICNNFYPAQLTLDKKDAQGYSVYYRFSDDLDACLEKFCRKYFNKEPVSVRKMVKSYINFFIYNRVSFIAMVEEKDDFRYQERNVKHIFYLVRHPLNSVIISFYQEKGYAFAQSPFSYIEIKYFLRPLYHLVLLLCAPFRPQKPETNIVKIKPAVWVEYAHGSFLDRTYWREMLNQNDFDIVYYLYREDDPPIALVAELAGSRNCKWVNLHFRSLIKLAHLGLSPIIGLLEVFLADTTCPFLWFKVLLFEREMWFLLYQSVFRQFKVKVLIQHEECSWVQEPQIRAIESAGGIMLGFHWSNHPYYKEPLIFSPEHVFFVWGKMMYECWRKRGNACKYLLPVGLWFVNAREGQYERIFFPKSAKFVIAIFDGAIGYNAYQSAETLSLFYLGILQLLEENPQWGGILKIKYSSFPELPRAAQIQQKINALKEQERLKVFNRMTNPIIASRNAHLSVCFSLSSAGIIAGISGCYAIHWDSAGFLHNPIYKDKSQKILYTDFELFKKAIIDFSNGNREIGDFSKWRQKFNYFNDLNGHRRIGKFIQSFMEKVTVGATVTGALSSAVGDYIAEHKIDGGFFDDSGLWDINKKGDATHS